MAIWRWLLASTFIALSFTGCTSIPNPFEEAPAPKPISLKEKPPNELADQVEPSVVLITYEDKEGHGTGFFVAGAEGICTVLTAAHVVKPSSKLLVTTDDQKLWKVLNIQRLPNVDLAVVTFKPLNSKNCPYQSLALGNSDIVKIGQRIYISGYPERAGESEVVKQFAGGEVTTITKMPLPEGYAISYNVTAVGGMSGAPVINVAGQVIAVHGKTDTEIITLANTEQSSLSIEQKVQLQKINNRVETVTRINHFKWGIPIKSYLLAPKTAEQWYDLGEKLLSSKQYQDAVDAYDNAIKSDEKVPCILLKRAIAIEQLKVNNKATDFYEEAIKISRKKLEPTEKELSCIASMLEKLEQYDEAIFYYEKVIDINPNNSSIWFSRAKALEKAKMLYQALASYEKAIKIKPNYYEALLGKGDVLEKLNRSDEARASFEKAKQIKSKEINK